MYKSAVIFCYYVNVSTYFVIDIFHFGFHGYMYLQLQAFDALGLLAITKQELQESKVSIQNSNGHEELLCAHHKFEDDMVINWLVMVQMSCRK